MKPEDPRRAMVIDTLLAVSMFILSIGSVIVWQSDADPATTPLNTWGYALMAGQTIPLIWRRKAHTHQARAAQALQDHR